jgi:hypothetical protein
MNAQKAQTLQLHEMVVWTPDGTKGEIIAEDGSGVNIRWEDGQFGYYRFTDLLSQIERFPCETPRNFFREHPADSMLDPLFASWRRCPWALSRRPPAVIAHLASAAGGDGSGG